MDRTFTVELDDQLRLDDPFDLIAELVIQTYRNEGLQDALSAPKAPEATVPAPPRSARPESYDLAGAAKYLGMTPRKLRELFKARRVAGSRIDYRHYLFTRADLNEFLAAYRSKAKRI